VSPSPEAIDKLQALALDVESFRGWAKQLSEALQKSEAALTEARARIQELETRSGSSSSSSGS
jgi:hypothetical protein